MANVHYLQHVAFEDLGSMEPALTAAGQSLSCTRLYLDEALPDVDALDWLIIMGGPMGVHDEATYPWLAREKRFIRACIDADKTVIGICLGAQLIASVLGAKVYPHQHREIGWFPLTVTDAAASTAIGSVLDNSAAVFHWHGDTFDLPEGATLLASSAACENQAFIWQGRVIALQFHLETTADSAQALIANCGDELDGSTYVQSAAMMLSDAERFNEINTMMTRLLSVLPRA